MERLNRQMDKGQFKPLHYKWRYYENIRENTNSVLSDERNVNRHIHSEYINPLLSFLWI